jgi:hypothetical protein
MFDETGNRAEDYHTPSRLGVETILRPVDLKDQELLDSLHKYQGKDIIQQTLTPELKELALEIATFHKYNSLDEVCVNVDGGVRMYSSNTSEAIKPTIIENKPKRNTMDRLLDQMSHYLMRTSGARDFASDTEPISVSTTTTGRDCNWIEYHVGVQKR